MEFEPPLWEHPVYNGAKAILLLPVLYKPEPEAFEALFLAASRYDRAQLRIMVESRTCVWKARERLVHRFLQTDAAYAIFADHDHIFPIGMEGWMSKMSGGKTFPARMEKQNFFTRLLSHPANIGIVGAHYFDRFTGMQGMWDGACGPERDMALAARVRNGEMNGLLPRGWVAPGGMRIARWVFEKIAAEAPKKFPEIVPKKAGARFGFFTPLTVDIGEDVSFCMRAAACGITSYLDCDLRILHIGKAYF